MDTFDLRTYLDLASRRKYWIILTFLLAVLAGLTYLLVVPKLYEAKTVVLVHPQDIPTDYVRPLISQDVDFTLDTIARQVTSEANLEKIIKEHDLYSEPGNPMLLYERVGLMRERIKIDRDAAITFRRGMRVMEINSFSITFQGENPQKVMNVANALASNFITENLKLRESQSLGTSAFLDDEIQSVAKQLSEKEEEIKQYRQRHMGNLPEQLQTNLNTLARLETQLEAYRDSLRDAQSKKVVIQEEIEEERRNFFVGLSTGLEYEVKDLHSLKNLLRSLKTRYTEDHPDVIRLEKLISDLQIEQSKPSSTQNSIGENSLVFGVPPALKRQLADTELTIKSREADIREVKIEIMSYQKKVDQTPVREQELRSLNRDYEQRRELYGSLLDKKMEANLAVNMEMRQKGQQFRILDPAKLPIKPVKPKILVIAALTLMLGLGLGVFLAITRELTDTSFKTPEEAEKELQVPVLVSIPTHYTKRERWILKSKGVLRATSVVVGFVACATGIVLATDSLDATLDFAKNLRDRSMIIFSSTDEPLLTDKSQNPPPK